VKILLLSCFESQLYCFFFSFFLGFRRPDHCLFCLFCLFVWVSKTHPITGLSGWRTPDEPLRTPEPVPDRRIGALPITRLIFLTHRFVESRTLFFHTQRWLFSSASDERYAKFADCLRRAGQLPQCTCKGGGTDSITKSRGVEQFTEHAVVLILRGRIYQSWEVGPHRCDIARKESDGMN